MILPNALLLATLMSLVWFLKGDLLGYRRIKRLPDTASRQKTYRLWIAKAAIAFVLPAIIGLALLDRLDALVTVPPEFDALRTLLPSLAGDSRVELLAMIGGSALGGLVIGAVLATRRNWRILKTIGNVGSLLPRNRPEIAHAAAMSIMAGVSEELAFRLFLPLLVALVSGSAFVAFGVAVAAFGAMHLYQGLAGVIATTLVGALMAAVYLMTGELWLAMVLHALIDLNSLALRPALTGAWRAA
ncbi:CAAX prenyl protease-like protein [Sphingomonas sp. PP-F2F-A104-K0414]|uniref:CPBP family intramembrane glutamic endopeptidase n=1 Tax=Sphingomonas sp. PP-F2F-A104-K0414 TaxID=2135661 RepID=UPI001053F42B|nr:CPBP family intramembrane glutamic endopeptidase [Sphingomonas sp. PP-F2F-A104-K0414]TCQ00112.1 CAAX prenyl protease-like protein [Sphingomonas sp. PP-F2F-A104-K0414]